MPGKRKFHATITTRYGLPEKNIYEQVMDLVEKKNIAKSRAQLLLVERGLQHTHNPELAKHLGQGIEEHIQGDPLKSGQHPSADKLMTQDKAGPPVTALEEKKSANWVGPTLIGGGLIALLLYLIIR